MPSFRANALSLLAALAALATIAACSGGAQEPAARAAPGPRAPVADPARHGAAIGALPRLVFFMNPDGAPCQLQDRILREMTAELAGRAELVYYRTTEQADLPRFAEYGIRALPSLVVTDAGGRELRRATPGIQPPEQIRRLLAP